MNAITDVAGVRVGQVQRIGDGWLTGVTVVVPPPASPTAVSIRGAAPATHQTAALHRGAVSPSPQAIVLAGGSSLGLVTVHGVARRFIEDDRGYRIDPTPGHVLPLIPGAAIFDNGRGGDISATPTLHMGYEAADRALASGEDTPVATGNVGAGTGAAILDERFKGGLGTASVTVTLAGVTVTLGALAVVNAFGGPADHAATPAAVRQGLPHPGYPPSSTVLAVVATDADLDLGTLWQTADACHDGLARAIDPVHTVADGDTVFAISTRQVTLPGADVRFTEPRQWRDAVIGLQATAARVVRDAIMDGIASATAVTTPMLTLPTFPGADTDEIDISP